VEVGNDEPTTTGAVAGVIVNVPVPNLEDGKS
jgi:hypothetical protein